MNARRMVGPEEAKVKELAEDYTKRGYQVITDKRAWPSFLAGFEPDLVAVSGDDKVVVEVKVRRHARVRFGLHAIAEAVGRQPDWRLELVVVDDVAIPAVLSAEQVRRRLDEAKLVFDMSPAGAFLLAWSAIEALLRTILQDSAFAAARMSPVMMIKTATAEGLIPQDTGDLLSNAAQLRNGVAHGISEDESLLEPRTFEAFLLEATSLLASLEHPHADFGQNVSADQMVEWFSENYEDPANGVPYETAEGGYIYYLGGPYDAADILWEHFPDAEADVVEAAKSRIQDEGYEWVKKGQYPS